MSFFRGSLIGKIICKNNINSHLFSNRKYSITSLEFMDQLKKYIFRE